MHARCEDAMMILNTCKKKEKVNVIFAIVVAIRFNILCLTFPIVIAINYFVLLSKIFLNR